MAVGGWVISCRPISEGLGVFLAVPTCERTDLTCRVTAGVIRSAFAGRSAHDESRVPRDRRLSINFR